MCLTRQEKEPENKVRKPKPQVTIGYVKTADGRQMDFKECFLHFFYLKIKAQQINGYTVFPGIVLHSPS